MQILGSLDLLDDRSSTCGSDCGLDHLVRMPFGLCVQFGRYLERTDHKEFGF